MTGPTRGGDEEPLEPAPDKELEEELGEGLGAEEAEAAKPLSPAEARARAAAARAAAVTPKGREEAAEAAAAARAPEEPIHVDDPVSKLFVVAIVVAFVGVFMYALLLGKAGLFEPPKSRPSATPVAETVAPSPTITLSASPSATPSASPVRSPSPGPTRSPSPGPTRSPSPGPTSPSLSPATPTPTGS